MGLIAKSPVAHNKTENRKLGIKIKHKNYEKDIYYFIISINNDWMLK